MKDIELTARATNNLRSKYVEDPITGCWQWTGATNGKGYGRLKSAGNEVLAHRYSAKLHGQDVEGWVVRHECDNSMCVNPEHFDTGTHLYHVDDKIIRGRMTRGEDCYNATLTEADVIYIRKSNLTGTELAAKLNKAVGTIRDARARRSWKHI